MYEQSYLEFPEGDECFDVEIAQKLLNEKAEGKPFRQKL